MTDTAIDPQSITEVVTIDGPAGAGKSSVAREVARRLDFAYLDTGAMYRAATLWALAQGIDEWDRDGLIRVTRSMPLAMDWDGARFHVVVDGAEVSEAIRSPEITERIGRLAGIPEVRAHLVGLQREFASEHPIVTEGRDQGTVVFPAAKCKIYLDASLEERARRRAEQYAEQHVHVDVEELRDAIARRDRSDSGRETAPLKPAEDAIIVDTTALGFEEVVERILKIAHERLG